MEVCICSPHLSDWQTDVDKYKPISILPVVTKINVKVVTEQ